MKIVVQRAKNSSVSVEGKLVNKINFGLVILVGFSTSDTMENVEKMVKKVLNLRIFDDDAGVMNKSILDVKGQILSISQFTLYADCKKGNRPSYVGAMNGKQAIVLYEKFNQLLNESVETYPGVFGADMLLEITNDGPVTIILEN